MNKSNTLTELATALSKAQAEMPSLELNAENPYFKSRYADLGGIIKTAKSILAKHGLAISQLPTSVDGKVGLTTVLIHSSGEFIESTVLLPLPEESRNLAQSAGGMITYLRRYSYAAILGLYADEDLDGNIPGQKQSDNVEPTKAKGKMWDEVFVKAFIDNKIAENPPNAVAILNLLDPETPEDAVKLGKIYRGWRDGDKEPLEAAELTLAGKTPK